MADEPIAWGAKVSPQFRYQVCRISDRLGFKPSDLMACMAFETGRTFDPSIRNAAGSGATGLIQFMPQTAHALGTTTEALAAMSDIQQLVYVEAYFRPSKGRLKGRHDLYMAILWPSAIGKPDFTVIFDRKDLSHPARYIQNAELDYNRNGQITRLEACAGVDRMYAMGIKPGNIA